MYDGRGLGFAMPPSSIGMRTRASISSRSAVPAPLHLRAQESEENIVEKYRKILNDVDSKPAAARKEATFFSKFFQSAKVKTCETDYDCNPGGRNYPLRCVNYIFSKICVESDDDFSGGRGVMEYAFEPIPVRVTDGYYGKGGGRDYDL